MNKKIILAGTISLSLLLACNGKKVENSVVAVEPTYDETHEAFLENQPSEMEDSVFIETLLDSKELSDNDTISFENIYEKVQKSVPPIIDNIMELIDEEQYVDALKLYNRNEGDIMIYLETSTQIYGFHREIVRPLLFETMEKDDATTEYLNILELDFAMAEFAIAAGTENNYIPEHYADLLDDLYIGYSILQNWDKAIEFSNKHVDFIKEQKGAVSQDYAQAIRIQAEMYYKMGKKKIAVSLMQKAKQIYELNENLVRVNYCNRKLDEWK